MNNRLSWRLGAFALAASVCLSQFAMAFNDLSNNNWASQYINYLSSRNVITGYPDNTFRPDRPVTRAEFAVMLAKSQNMAMGMGDSRFADVPSSHWAASAINAVANQGWIAGYSNGTFQPNKNISMAEMYAIMAQAGGQAMLDDTAATTAINMYQDASQVPSWARRAVGTVLNQGIGVTELGNLYPNAAATRASVATTIAKLVNTAWRHPSSSGSVATTTDTTTTNLGSPVDVSGTLQATATPGEWAVNTATGERYFLVNPASGITGQSWFRVGNQVHLTGNIDKTNSTSSRWVIVPTNVAQVASATTASVSGMLRPSTTDANAWVVTTADNKTYRLLNPEAIKNDPLFRYGSNVTLTGSQRPDVSLPTADGTAFVVSSIATAQTGSQVSVTGTLKPTTEAGGWIVDTGTQKYVLLGSDPVENQSWFKSGAQVMVSGNVRTDIPTIYNEGPVLVVNTLQASPTSATGSQQVSLYLPNSVPVLGQFAPAVRVIEGPDIPTKAVQALLDGPSDFEKIRGYYQDPKLSVLNVNSVSVASNGTANVVLNAPAGFSFNPASQQSLLNQVRQTLSQVSGINDVSVSVKAPSGTVLWTSP